tara:strand:- start:5169 stop:5867 length:699 start_codon:yes stop_codon:yes gene_type:complete
MIAELLKDILYLFYPITCSNCDIYLKRNESLICIQCRHDLPYSHYTKHKENPVERLFFGRTPIQAGTSLFIFEQNGMAQTLIHKLKYQGKESIGNFAGYLLADELKKSLKYQNLDYIIPVPLHIKKQKKRGYNQLSEFGKSLSETLKIPFKENILLKISSSDTQTKKNKFDRWKNATESFQLLDVQFLENKHILLIDDVVTTGATLESCSNELLKIKNITISIATIAHTANF